MTSMENSFLNSFGYVRKERYMLSIYPACFFKEEKGYSVIFPDLNWLATCGETEEEAMSMAVDCLAGYLYTSKIDGEEIPAPSARSAISLETVAKELDANPKDAWQK